MKRGEFTPCIGCGEPVGVASKVVFYRVTIEKMVFDHRAIQTTTGLAVQLRSPALVDVFNPTPELANQMGESDRVLVCLNCGLRKTVADLEDRIAERLCSDDADGSPTEAPTDPPPSDDPTSPTPAAA